MQKQTILRKETYVSPGPSTPLSLKQYVILKNSQGEKLLLLRLSNQLNERCTSYGFWIYQYDSHNVLLQKKRFDVKRAACIPGLFVFGKEIPLDDRCDDIEFHPIYAKFGDYTCTFEDNKTSVRFTKPYTPAVGDWDFSTNRVTKKNLPNIVWPYLLIALLAMVFIFIVIGVLFDMFLVENPYYNFMISSLQHIAGIPKQLKSLGSITHSGLQSFHFTNFT